MNQKTPQLTDSEQEIILTALKLVSPLGGGSPPWTVFQKLSNAWGKGHSLELEQQFDATVFEGRAEALIGEDWQEQVKAYPALEKFFFPIPQ